MEEPGGLGSLVDLEALDTEKTAPAFYAVVPLAALVIGFFLLDRDLVQAQILALAVQFVLYTACLLYTSCLPFTWRRLSICSVTGPRSPATLSYRAYRP